MAPFRRTKSGLILDPRMKKEIDLDYYKKNRVKILEGRKLRRQMKQELIEETKTSPTMEELSRRFPFVDGSRRMWVTKECKYNSLDLHSPYCKDEMCRCLCHMF